MQYHSLYPNAQNRPKVCFAFGLCLCVIQPKAESQHKAQPRVEIRRISKLAHRPFYQNFVLIEKWSPISISQRISRSLLEIHPKRVTHWSREIKMSENQHFCVDFREIQKNALKRAFFYYPSVKSFTRPNHFAGFSLNPAFSENQHFCVDFHHFPGNRRFPGFVKSSLNQAKGLI